MWFLNFKIFDKYGGTNDQCWGNKITNSCKYTIIKLVQLTLRQLLHPWLIWKCFINLILTLEMKRIREHCAITEHLRVVSRILLRHARKLHAPWQPEGPSTSAYEYISQTFSAFYFQSFWRLCMYINRLCNSFGFFFSFFCCKIAATYQKLTDCN